MRRWHEEAPRLRKLWKQELQKHQVRMWWHLTGGTPESERYVFGVKLYGLQCHCEKGVGVIRKRKPYAHSRSTCLCKAEKNFRQGYKSLWRKWRLEDELLAYEGGDDMTH